MGAPGHAVAVVCNANFATLNHPPYADDAMERELGLRGRDGRRTPAAAAIVEFAAMTARIGELPEFRRDAVCILSRNQDSWGVAYTSFILAKQAGFDLEFQTVEQPLRDADFYLLPAIGTTEPVPLGFYRALLEKVAAGATLLVSWAGGVLQPFEEVFQLRPEWRETHAQPWQMRFAEAPDHEPGLEFRQSLRLVCTTTGAELLAADDAGHPVFTAGRCGNGRVLFLGVGLESELADVPGAFGGAEGGNYWRIYACAARLAGVRRLMYSGDPRVTLTEHFHSSGKATVVAVNNSPETLNMTFRPEPGWRRTDAAAGTSCVMPPNSGHILTLTKEEEGKQ